MVAFSLYKGNLHKVPDVPRRWRLPEHRISLMDFKILLRRRAKALSRLRSTATTSNPRDPSIATEDHLLNDDVGTRVDDPCCEPELHSNGDLKDAETTGEGGKLEDQKLVDKEDSSRKFVHKVEPLVGEIEINEANANRNDESEISGNHMVQINSTEDAIYDLDKDKKKIQEKLEILKEKKHGLVQVLKQILNAEEQIKSRNTTQFTPAHPGPPPQVDSVSIPKLNAPRMLSNGNTCRDSEVSLHQGYRKNAGAANSPSQLTGAPPRQVPLSVSISGTSDGASSPSPAASGGTSISRLSSPWN